MNAPYTRYEAVQIALSRYDDYREDGCGRAYALEQTCIDFSLHISPTELDELVRLRDTTGSQIVPKPFAIQDEDLHLWLS